MSTDYCSVSQLKEELGLDVTDERDDGPMGIAISAASRQIDGFAGWPFWQDDTVQARTFYPTNTQCLYLAGDGDGAGISTLTELIVKTDSTGTGSFGTTLAVNTDFIVGPANAARRVPAWPYTEIRLLSLWWPRVYTNRATVEITAKWGWPAVPDDITKACLVQAAQLFKSKDAVFGAVALGDTGAAMRVRSALNPTAAALVERYRTVGIA